MSSKISDSCRYGLIIVALKSVELLGNSMMYVSSEVDSSLYSSVHFFWCTLHTNTGELIGVSCILIVWGSFR